MKKKNVKQEYIERKSLEGWVQFDRSEKKLREDVLMKICDFHKYRSH